MIGGFQPLAFQTNFQQEAPVAIRRPRTHPRLRQIQEAAVASYSPLVSKLTLSSSSQVTVSAAVIVPVLPEITWARDLLPPLVFPETPKPPPYQRVTTHSGSWRFSGVLRPVTITCGVGAVPPCFTRVGVDVKSKRFSPMFIDLTPKRVAVAGAGAWGEMLYLHSRFADSVQIRAVNNPSDEELLAVVNALRAARTKRLTKRAFVR